MKEEARDREREGEERRDFGTVPCTLQRLPCSLEHGATVCVPKAGSRRLDAPQPPSTRVDPNLQIGLDIPPPPGEGTKISGHRGCNERQPFWTWLARACPDFSTRQCDFRTWIADSDAALARCFRTNRSHDGQGGDVGKRGEV